MARPAREVDFFRMWSPEMAYVLGYWWADGYMRIHSTTTAHLIELASNDQAHLLEMAQAVGINYSYRQITHSNQCFEVVFCSKQMYLDLEVLGGTPHKSRTTTMPEIPDLYLPHFIRGFVDGDGTLVWNGDRPVIQIYSASKELLLGIGKRIEEITGIPAPNIATNRDNWYIKWSTVRAKCLAAWLYFINPGIYLQRKYEIAQAFINWHPKKRPHRGTITDQMYLYFSDYLPE